MKDKIFITTDDVGLRTSIKAHNKAARMKCTCPRAPFRRTVQQAEQIHNCAVHGGKNRPTR